ncbi:MAG: hypothetical protein H6R26_1796, partial [Proteobacteria bacterium]|nr:hypothetical protein [Pseudomonadota bacterium]
MNDSQKWFVLVGLAGTAWLIYLLAPILTPFVAGALLAYLCDPLADRLENAGLRRQTAVISVFAAVTVMGVLAVFFVVPLLEFQVGRLVAKLPGFTAWLKSSFFPWLHSRFGIRADLGVGLDQLSALLGTYWQEAGGLAASIIKSLSHSGAVLLAWVMNLLLIP